MTKNYQTKTAPVATAVEAALPDVVSVTLAELAGSLREGLLALAVGAGFQVMDAIIAESVNALAGPKGVHDPDRGAPRLRGRLGGAGRPAGGGAPAPGPHGGPRRRGGGARL